MAEKGDPSNPPTNANIDENESQDLDDNFDDNDDDLFVSTVEVSLNFFAINRFSNDLQNWFQSHSNSKFNDNTIEETNHSKMDPIDELMASHEISLDDDDDSFHTNDRMKTNGSTVLPKAVNNSSEGKQVQFNAPEVLKAVLPTSSTTLSAAETLKNNTNSRSETTTNSNSVKNSSNEKHIEITVGEPQRIGEGMSAYVVYRVVTKTDLPYFRKSQFCGQSKV